MLIGGVALLVLVGGGVGAGVYASSAGLIGGGGHARCEVDDGKPKLVPKSEQKPASAEGEGEGGGHGGGEDAGPGGRPRHEATPQGRRRRSNMPRPTLRWRRNSPRTSRTRSHFVQVGVAVSTPYDKTVIEQPQDQRDRGAFGDPDDARRHHRGTGVHRRRQTPAAGRGWPKRSTTRSSRRKDSAGSVTFTLPVLLFSESWLTRHSPTTARAARAGSTPGRARSDGVLHQGCSTKLNPFGDLHTLQHLSARFARDPRAVFEPIAAPGSAQLGRAAGGAALRRLPRRTRRGADRLVAAGDDAGRRRRR